MDLGGHAHVVSAPRCCIVDYLCTQSGTLLFLDRLAGNFSLIPREESFDRCEGYDGLLSCPIDFRCNQLVVVHVRAYQYPYPANSCIFGTRWRDFDSVLV